MRHEGNLKADIGSFSDFQFHCPMLHSFFDLSRKKRQERFLQNQVKRRSTLGSGTNLKLSGLSLALPNTPNQPNAACITQEYTTCNYISIQFCFYSCAAVFTPTPDAGSTNPENCSCTNHDYPNSDHH